MRNKLYLLFGLFLIAIYCWTIFFFIRPAREIPFQLNILRLYILLWIVLLYSFFLYKSLTKSDKTTKIIPKVIIKLFVIIRESLGKVDQYLKYPFQLYYLKLFRYLAKKITLNNTTFWARIIFALNLLPRLILLSVFFIDVFHFHTLFYLFKILWLSLFLFLPQYFIYCLLDTCEPIISFLEKNLKHIGTDYVYGILPPEEDYWNDAYIKNEEEDDEPPHEMYLTVKRFLEFKYNCLLFNKHLKNSFCCNFTPEYYYQYKDKIGIGKEKMLTEEQQDDLYNSLNKKVDDIIHVYKISIFYDNIQKLNGENLNMKTAFTLILWFYLLSWLYILIVSINTLSITELLEFLKTLSFYTTRINPFENP